MAKDSKAVEDAARLRRPRRAAFAALVFERVWPTLFALLCLVALFFVLAWFGLFAAIPPLGRIAVLGLFAVAALAVLWRARRLRLPSAEIVDARIEAENRLRHQPLQIQGEAPVHGDPFALALWHEHQRRMAERLRGLTGGAPKARTERLDPFGLRALLALLLVTGFAFSYGARGGRVEDAFRPGTSPLLVEGRVDAWVTPPPYTGRAPIFLTDAGAGEAPGAQSVPAGSVLSIRVSEMPGVSLEFTPDGGEAAPVAPIGAEADEGKTAPAAGKTERSDPAVGGAGGFEVKLAKSGTAVLSTALRTLGTWRFDVTPDSAPQIAFIGEPAVARNGSLELAYSVTDDYGVRQARAEIAVEGATPGARPLIPVPKITLALPRRTKGEAKGRSSTDLTDSPYAGANVTMTLVATDDAWQAGRSEPKTFTLPERAFSKPLARAVVEQRRILALDANKVPRVLDMLDAVTLRGDGYIDSAGDYLALRAVRSRIAGARDDETLVSAIDMMWQIALGIEDGNLSLAEKKLRDARENLADALEKGASDAEIDKLMAELRQAMQEYMQAMAEAMKNQKPMSPSEMQNAQEIRPSDLEKMMDRIEELAKSGSKEAAQQLLSELQQMMDNMQAVRPGQQQQGGEDDAMRQQMDKLGEILRQQQALKDQTYDLGRQQMERQQRDMGEQQTGRDGKEPMSAEELQKQLDALKQQQGQLQKDLQQMQEAMKGMGMQPGEGFGEAGKAMGQAESALGEGNDGEAVGQQGQAMEALRRGAKDMMRQMQEAMQQGEGQQPGGQGQMGAGYGRGEQRSGRDPLGRPRSTQGADFGQDVKVPDEIDTQRARRILDAIRERLGDALSPELERQYLERLLKPQ